MRPWKKTLSALLFAAAIIAHAGEISVTSAQITPSDEGYALAAEFDIKLGAPLEDAVRRGVPLFFSLKLDVRRARWYWLDEHVIDYRLDHRLSYNALTREYRLSSGGLGRSFDNIAAALAAMARPGAVHIAEKDAFVRGQSYACDVILTLNRNQLPKPLQVDALANRDWQTDSLAYRWIYKP